MHFSLFLVFFWVFCSRHVCISLFTLALYDGIVTGIRHTQEPAYILDNNTVSKLPSNIFCGKQRNIYDRSQVLACLQEKL